ncbi:MAG: hypothetical protein WBB34_23315 [Xanthobacteraceae bacterium]
MTDFNNFQRRGAVSNAHAGREFEEAARLFFENSGIPLSQTFPVPVGGHIKKQHNFDLGSEDPPILVECKSYTWTETGKPPSAKIRGMNEVMLLFGLSPPRYRKILFVLKHLHQRTQQSLATHYIRTQGHLIPEGVEIWEFDLDEKHGARVFPT